MDFIQSFIPKNEDELIFVLEVIHIIGAFSLFVTAIHPIPYGRYESHLKLKTGITLSAKLVWRGFCVTWIIPVLIVIFSPSHLISLSNIPNVVALGLYIGHYLYRSLIYPKSLKNGSSWPIESALMAWIGCAFNGFIQAFHLSSVYRIKRIGITNILGLLLFFVGLIINISHDEILVNLRNPKKSASSSSSSSSKKSPVRYMIPRGGLFNYVSAANYFGEIIEWIGFALFTGGLPQIIFAFTTMILIGVRGYQYHQFYKRTFGNVYPAERKAIIPFIF